MESWGDRSRVAVADLPIGNAASAESRCLRITPVSSNGRGSRFRAEIYQAPVPIPYHGVSVEQAVQALPKALPEVSRLPR
jgi:hypothetical protein